MQRSASQRNFIRAMIPAPSSRCDLTQGDLGFLHPCRRIITVGRDRTAWQPAADTCRPYGRPARRVRPTLSDADRRSPKLERLQAFQRFGDAGDAVAGMTLNEHRLD